MERNVNIISSAYDFDHFSIMDAQLICSVYKLGNGIVYKWNRKNLYEDYQLHIVHDAGNKDVDAEPLEHH